MPVIHLDNELLRINQYPVTLIFDML